MDDLLLKKRISELRKRAEFSYQTECTEFLTLSEIETAKMVLNGCNYRFFGGLEDSERQMLCIAHEDIEITDEIFPITGILVTPKSIKFSEAFSHRDVLGSVLGLGLQRDVIGDIFVSEKEAFILCSEHISDFIQENLLKVRHTNVICRKIAAEETSFKKEYKLMERTVSAIRIDTICAVAFGVSRSSAATAISAGKIFINGREIISPSSGVKEEDVISFRGEGKAKLKEIGGLTKKGRICVTIERYQ